MTGISENFDFINYEQTNSEPLNISPNFDDDQSPLTSINWPKVLQFLHPF